MPRRGGGWPRETLLPHSGKPTPPRFARLPLPEEGARMFFKEALIQSMPFAVRDSRPHICRALLRFPHLSFIPPVPYPPLRGTFPSRGRLAIRENLRSTDLRASPRFIILSGEKGKVKMDKYTGKKNDASLLHDICGHRPIYSRRSRHLHSSFLISHSSFLIPNSNPSPLKIFS